MSGHDDPIRRRTDRSTPAKVMVWILVVLIVISMVALMVP